MRKILFKGKRNDWKKLSKEKWWVEGCALQLDDGRFLIATSCLENDKDEVERMIEVCVYEIDPEMMCQYTEFPDKNGNNICEGDIVKTKFFGKCQDDVNFTDYDIFKIVYDKGAFYFENSTRRFLIDERAKVEIIGNVFDNPELLEVQNG